MDPNGSRYHLFLSRDDWLGDGGVPVPRGGLAHDPDRGLHLHPLPYRYPEPKGDRQPRLADRRGVAADRFHNLYWVDDAGTGIRVRSAGSGGTSLFWRPGTGEEVHQPGPGDFAPASSPAAPRPTGLCGLAVTEDHYLVIGTRGPAGLLVFDLYQPASRTQQLWPEDVPFEPFDLCARTGGGVFILDRTNRLLWELDQRFGVVARRSAPAPYSPEFVPLAGEPAEPVLDATWPVAGRLEVADALPVTGDPWAVESAPGGRVLVLLRRDEGASQLQLLSPPIGTGPTVDLVEVREPADRLDGNPDPGLDVAPLAVVAHDLARTVPTADGATGRSLGRVLVADAGGNQSYAFDLTETEGELHARLVEDAYPMRLFGGKGIVADGYRVWYDLGDAWLPLLAQPRRRYMEAATLRTGPLDGGLPGTVWHRLLLDARIPAGCRVSACSRAADEVDELDLAGWRREPAFGYARSQGSELAFEADAVTAAGWATFEVLLQQAEGRYLQLQIELTGDQRSTPSLRALRVYYPRFSYVDRYLPAVYQQDPESASFLTRYLANTEGTLTGIESRIAAAQALFDPRTAPESALGWLLGWFDLAVDPTWGPDRLRLFLRHATAFLALRGTAAGLVAALRFALEECLDDTVLQPKGAGPGGYRIVERFATRRAPAPLTRTQQREVGVPATRWDPGQGRDDLLRRWRETTCDPAGDFPLAGGDQRWVDFVDRVLGLEPIEAIGEGDWQGFLRDRYGRVEDLNVAYGLVAATSYAAFEDVAAPGALPADGAALVDWYHYVSVVAPSRRGAHQFTVLLPVGRARQSEEDAHRRRAVATRVVELQKPAHATFDIRFFWSAFQVGSAVLGQDTQVELGGRDPQFHQSLVLGRDFAGETSLGGPPGPTGGHVGRDRLSS
jgi:phage tail-like protein